jgi:serine/threonine protein kinase
LDLAIQFCHSMEFSHSKGMIHRDIKVCKRSDNQRRFLRITDFGLVRISGFCLENSNIAASGGYGLRVSATN